MATRFCVSVISCLHRQQRLLLLSAEAQCCQHLGLRYFSKTSSAKTSGQTTIDKEELAKFNNAAKEWWSSSSDLAHPALHALNALRVPLVRNALLSRKAIMKQATSGIESPASPLSGMTVLDVGCGGGILSEPLARLGAQVTGLDASRALINAAKWHADQDPDLRGRIHYICTTVEELCSDPDTTRFDGVVASEVIEHVADVAMFVSACCKLVKPGGSLFFTTMNRTWPSYMLAIVVAEYMFGVIPRGTHDWNKFLSPEEIERHLAPGFSVRLVNGMLLNPVTCRWTLATTTDVNYMFHAVNLNYESSSDKATE